MIVKLLNDIMYGEEKQKDTYLWKWAIENNKDYYKIWKDLQLLQDFLHSIRIREPKKQQYEEKETQLNLFDTIDKDKKI